MSRDRLLSEIQASQAMYLLDNHKQAVPNERVCVCQPLLLLLLCDASNAWVLILVESGKLVETIICWLLKWFDKSMWGSINVVSLWILYLSFFFPITLAHM